MKKYRVAILGTGNIGTDLMVKAVRSPYLDCVAFVGRSRNTVGLAKAIELGVRYSDRSINFIRDHAEEIDLVFDATSAKDHKLHAPILRELGLRVIDLTPAKVGPMAIPAVNILQCMDEMNINMVTCGGQASIPIAYAIGRVHDDIEYIEAVSSIASRSAGPATRLNLDEYIATTETGLKLFSGAKQAKAILNLNPAVPCIHMQTTVFAKVAKPDIEGIRVELSKLVAKLETYVPGYKVVLGPLCENERVVVTVRVRGLGDYLPEYAGNLDIINCAAIGVAEEYAKQRCG